MQHCVLRLIKLPPPEVWLGVKSRATYLEVFRCLHSVNVWRMLNVSATTSAAVSNTSSSGAAESGEDRQNSVNALKYRVDQVRHLRQDVERLRSAVIDMMAEDMGRRLTCNPQWLIHLWSTCYSLWFTRGRLWYILHKCDLSMCCDHVPLRQLWIYWWKRSWSLIAIQRINEICVDDHSSLILFQMQQFWSVVE